MLLCFACVCVCVGGGTTEQMVCCHGCCFKSCKACWTGVWVGAIRLALGYCLFEAELPFPQLVLIADLVIMAFLVLKVGLGSVLYISSPLVKGSFLKSSHELVDSKPLEKRWIPKTASTHAHGLGLNPH